MMDLEWQSKKKKKGKWEENATDWEEKRWLTNAVGEKFTASWAIGALMDEQKYGRVVYRECLKPPCSAAHFPRLGESRPKLNEINTRLMSNWGNSPATRVPHKQTHTISQPIVYLMTFMCLLWPSACVICRLFLTFLPFFRNEWARCHKTIWLKWFYRRLRGLKNKNEIKIRTPTAGAGDGAGNFTLLSVFSN